MWDLGGGYQVTVKGSIQPLALYTYDVPPCEYHAPEAWYGRAVPCKFKYKKPLFQHTLHQECGFLYLSSQCRLLRRRYSARGTEAGYAATRRVRSRNCTRRRRRSTARILTSGMPFGLAPPFFSPGFFKSFFPRHFWGEIPVILSVGGTLKRLGGAAALKRLGSTTEMFGGYH
eukprot:648082-Rhodomonas_salina.1